MSNPTTGADKSDAAGRFPQVFCADAAIFDILVKDAGGSTIASELSVVGLGSSTGSLVRDFTTSRFQARGAGGVTFVEGGDPTGDDVGGKLALGGWNGTQADEIDINAVLVKIIGRLKENGYKIPGTVRQEAVTFSGAAFVAIPLTNDPSGARVFEVDIIDLIQSATAQNLLLTLSFDGGVTYSAANYQWSLNFAYSTTNGAAGGAADTRSLVATSNSTPAGQPAFIRMSILTPDSGSNMTMILGQTVGYYSIGAAIATTNFSIASAPSLGRATHVKLAVGSGTIAGVYRVTPQRGLGET